MVRHLFPAALGGLVVLRACVGATPMLVEGDNLRIFYDGGATWGGTLEDGDTGDTAAPEAGSLQTRFDEVWVDWGGGPTVSTAWSARFEDAKGLTIDVGSTGSSPELTMEPRMDTVTARAFMRVATETVNVSRTDEWLLADRALTTFVDAENVSGTTLHALRFLFMFDPVDPRTGTTETCNGVADLDGDGTPEWAESVSADATAPWTLGFGVCDEATQAVGHVNLTELAFDLDLVPQDDHGKCLDRALLLQGLVGDVPAGAVAGARYIVVTAADPTAARAAYQALRFGCPNCDDDRDGAYDADCGGTDCADLDSTIYPGAPDAPYDGEDTNCDGAAEFDADGDGHDSDAWGGDDCDDDDAGVYPGAPDDWYDGEDTNCDGNDDDQDLDGHPVDVDCDDRDAAVHPGAQDAPYDGVDADCAGDSDCDVDGDGADATVCGGDDCYDEDPALQCAFGLPSDVWGSGGCQTGGRGSLGGLALAVLALCAGRRGRVVPDCLYGTWSPKDTPPWRC